MSPSLASAKCFEKPLQLDVADPGGGIKAAASLWFGLSNHLFVSQAPGASGASPQH
jgi:hypothetical protein